MGASGTTVIDFGPAPQPAAAKTFYFHTETALNGSATAPTGCLTASETVPDQTDANAASIAGGHSSTSTGVETSELVKPTTKDETGVSGSPPSVNTPIAAHQFGWFSDQTYNGTFAGAQWTFQWREDDNSGAITGDPQINVFAASTTRDFTTMRFLGRIFSSPPIDWWLGAANSLNYITTHFPPMTLNNEFLFFQVWCHESAGFAAAKTHTFHQEGSDLTAVQRSCVITPPFAPTLTPDIKLTVTAAGILSTSLVEAWIFPGAGTADHSADEHAFSNVEITAGNINQGAGTFQIWASGFDVPASDGVRAGGRPLVNPAVLPWGKWNVAWVWN